MIQVYSSDGAAVEFKYIGSTEDYDRRMSNHSSKSSNPDLNKYADMGRKITSEVLEEVIYFRNEELLEREQFHMDRVPTEMLLNRMNAIGSSRTLRPATGIEACK
jgi:hypothetical protein